MGWMHGGVVLSTHSMTHARLGLPVNLYSIPVPAVQYGMELYDTAAKSTVFNKKLLEEVSIAYWLLTGDRNSKNGETNFLVHFCSSVEL